LKGIQKPPLISIVHPNLTANKNSTPVQKVSPFLGKITDEKSNRTGRLGYITVSGNSNLIFKAVKLLSILSGPYSSKKSFSEQGYICFFTSQSG